MNYNSLFNLIYSTEISEATKDEIISKISQPIEESTNAEPLVETYIDLLDTLVFSTASEALINDIIDEAFSKLDEEFINEVSNEWIKRKVESGLKSREQAVKKTNNGGIIGLSQLKRNAAAQDKLNKGKEQAAKLGVDTSATGKLKSAVGKVKNWVDSKSPVPKPVDHVGLSRMIARKANKENIGAEELRQKTTSTSSSPKVSTNGSPKAKATVSTTPKAKATVSTTPKAKATVSTTPKAKATVSTTPKAKATVSTTPKKEEAARKAATENEVKKRQEGFEKLKASAKKVAKTKETTPEKSKVEAPETEATQTPEKSKVEAPKVTKKKSVNKSIKKVAKTKETTPEKSKVEAPKVDNKETNKEAITAVKTAKETTPEKSKVEAPKVDNKKAIEEPAKSSGDKQLDMLMNQSQPKKRDSSGLDKRREAERRKNKEEVLSTYEERLNNETSKPGADPKTIKDLQDRIAGLRKELGKDDQTNEALSEFIYLLTRTNISESCFLEVMETITVSKAKAEKAKKRHESDFWTEVDNMNKDLAAGKPIDPSKAERERQKLERFEKIFNNKFSNNN